MPSTLLLLVLLSFATPAWSIYKCVSGDQTVYSDAPCQNGAAGSMKEIAVATPATDIASAQKQLQQDKQTLQRLQQRRHKADAQEERQQAQRYKAAEAKKKKCAESAQRVKWANEDAASAHPKTAERSRQKARRATEKHQLACG